MTVNQFLYDKYIGKSISFYVDEEKDKEGNIRKEYSRRQDTIFPKWEHRIWTKKEQGVDKEFWVRDVKITDKIVKITQKSNRWIFETLTGYKFEFFADTELLII